MIRPLRQYHFYAWRVIALFLPPIFVLAIAFKTEPVSTYRSANNFVFDVKKLTSSSAQLTVEVRGSMRAPSCVIYVNEGGGEILVGRIDGAGIWEFEIPVADNFVSVRLHDPIHRKDILEKKDIPND